jgi:general secretion pathway protein G
VRSKRGFTLVELLVVVIILGVLAAIVVPQFSDHSDDARLATLDTTLAEMRSAVELYYHQHNGTYPGANKADGTPGGTAADFVQQLTMFTDATGKVSDTKTSEFKYGPYLRKGELPVNPFTGTNDIGLSAATSLTASIQGGSEAWKFAVPIGKFIANDSTHADR